MSGLNWISYDSTNGNLNSNDYSNNKKTLYSNAISFFNSNPTPLFNGSLTKLQTLIVINTSTPPFSTFTDGSANRTNVAIKFNGFFCPNKTGNWTFTLGCIVDTRRRCDDFGIMFLGIPGPPPGSNINPSATFTSLSTVPSNTQPILYNVKWEGNNAKISTTVELIEGLYYPISIYYNRSLLNSLSLGLSYQLDGETEITDFNGTIFQKNQTIVCFKEGAKILTDIGYRPIETLRKGDRIKTLNDGYKAIDMIGCRNIVHTCSQTRIKEQLYLCSPTEFPEVFEDLVITGCHSILVDDFKDEDEKNQVVEVNSGRIFMTDGKLRVPACVDSRTSVYQTPGTYTIYHFALENDDYFMNYGIYANGLLVETCSQRYLKELSNMVLLGDSNSSV